LFFPVFVYAFAMPKLAGVAIVRDEGDIIESFVRRNLAVLDLLYILLHRSRDGTREIVMALRASGLPMRVFSDEGEGFHQSLRINSLARRAFTEGGADFVFPIDADEMLVAEDRAALEAELASLPANAGGSMQWETYAPAAGDDAAEPCPVRRLTHRFDTRPRWEPGERGAIDVMRTKLVLGKWFAGDEQAWIFEGNHVVLVNGQPSAVPVTAVRSAHFPVRTLEQLARKGVIGWLAFLASGQDPEKHGFALHWKWICETVAAGRPLTLADLQEFVALYAPAAKGRPLLRDPLPRGDYALEYAHLRRPQPLPAAAQVAEQLARAREPRPEGAD